MLTLPVLNLNWCIWLNKGRSYLFISYNFYFEKLIATSKIVPCHVLWVPVSKVILWWIIWMPSSEVLQDLFFYFWALHFFFEMIHQAILQFQADDFVSHLSIWLSLRQGHFAIWLSLRQGHSAIYLHIFSTSFWWSNLKCIESQGPSHLMGHGQQQRDRGRRRCSTCHD